MENNIIRFNSYKLERGGLLYDMYDQFNARVGDQGTPLVMQWAQGLTDTLIDLQAKKLHFYATGQVGQYLEKLKDGTGYQMSADASQVEYEDRNAAGTMDHGITKVKLPKQFFPQEGIFYGYFGLKDDQGNTYTSVNVWFRVLGGVPIMGAAIPYFSTRFDELMETCQGRIEDVLAQLRQEYQDEVKKNEDMSAETRAALSKLADAVGAIQAQIDAGNVVTLVKHNQDFSTLKSGQVELDKRIADRLAQIDTTPTVLASGDAIKDAYPNGKDGIFIAGDTWHKWVYVDGAWQDKGEYSTQALPLSKIPHNVKAYLDNSNAISWKKTTEPGSFAFTFGDDKLNINIIGDVRATIKVTDVIAAASLSSDVNYQDSYFNGKNYMCVYHPSADSVEFVKTNTLLKPEDLILFGNHFLSWVGGLLVDDALGKEIRKDPIQDYTNEGTHVIVYFDDGKHLQVGKSNDTNFNVILPDAGINIKGSVRLSISKDDFWKQLRSYPTIFTLDDSGKLSGAGFMIAYDLKMQKIIAYDTGTYLYWYQIPLLIHHYSSVNGGLLWDDYIKSRALTVNTGGSDAGTSSVPKYWKQNLDAAIARVRRNMAKAGSKGLTFLWITDQHWEITTATVRPQSLQ